MRNEHKYETAPAFHLHALRAIQELRAIFSAYSPCLADLVVPALHSIVTYGHSPLLGVPAEERTYLAIFKGRMQVLWLRRLLDLWLLS